MAPGTQVRCRRAAMLALACAAITAAIGLGIPVAHAASSLEPGAPPTRLVHETPVVRAPGNQLLLVLSRTGPAAAPRATVTLTLYSRLTTRSALQAAIGPDGPIGAVSSTPPIAARCAVAASSLRLAVTVAPAGVATGARTLCGHPAPVLRLGCATGCDGVYPLRISIAGAGTTTSLTTLVTYVSRSTASPLRVAWVLRVAGPQRGLAGAAGALSAIDAHPRVPMTVDVEGSAVATGADRPGAEAATDLLARAGGTRAHQLTTEPYVPADLGALRASDLRSEVVRQYALNQVVLAGVGVAAPRVPADSYATGPATPTAVAASASVGVRHLLIDGGALSEDPAVTLTWGSPFHVAGASPSPTALACDAGLADLSSSTGADPGLVAAQFLGELAFLHFEQPYLAAPRVVAIVTSATRAVTAPFVDDVLVGMSHNPVLKPMTARGAFAAVPVGANGFPAVRSLALAPSRPWPPATVSEIRFLRITTDALKSAIVSGTSPIPTIEGDLLSTERVLAPMTRERLFEHVHRSLELQLGYFRFDSGSITLTETSGSLPVTVVSTAPYTIRAELRLTSRRMTFPDGPRAVLLPSTVRSWRITANAATSGDLPLTARLISPDGRLVIAHAQIVVRVTPTSIVGIALTVGAVLVLALWWVRTSRRRAPAR